ncbi:hypothetical protein Ahy_B09g098919 [Arachis hypogaea]|uniref:MULE transposase domain-containing protein n=1 Tax=Arachis hypogaea TaxID=3818 RepID=A0A444XTB8_ARAHY|nr:hypothetical protein Ahy_B09g098919 [Arachis hypogaea]
MMCEISVVLYYDGHLMVRDCSIFDKVFWAFPAYVEAFKHCKWFVSVDGTHLYGKYGGVLLIVVTQDAFVIVESETTESLSFFLTNLRRHVTTQKGLLIIFDRSQVIKTALRDEDSGWHPPRAFHAYCVRHKTTNFMSRFKSTGGLAPSSRSTNSQASVLDYVWKSRE